MCGRYTLQVIDLDELAAEHEWEISEKAAEWQPRYNLAPTQDGLVVTHEAEQERAKVRLYRWGLVPSWAKDPKIGSRMINARGESVADKPAFRRAFARRRCLVLADGFFEWRREGKKKIPTYIRLASGQSMAFAGLWERWKTPEEEWLHTYTVITCEPNELVAPIHDRMPVILAPEDYDAWIAPREVDPDELRSLIRPHAGVEMEAFEVSVAVNRVANDAPELIEPAAEPRRTDWEQVGLFGDRGDES